MPELARYRPILYLDIDVVCDAKLDALLHRLAVSRNFHAPSENVLMRPEDWYGASLVTEDGLTVAPNHPGFTTGIMGFAAIDTIRQLFTLVTEVADGFVAKTGERTKHVEQPFANYAVLKSAAAELTLLHNYLDNRWYWLERPMARRGLAHFSGGTDGAPAKLPAMMSYVEKLRAAATSSGV
jgi:hypothetical protein